MTGRLRDARRRARPAVPQHHARALLRAVRPADVSPGLARPPRAVDAGRATSTWRSATRSTTGRNSRRSASPRRACCRSPSTPTRITGGASPAGAREDPGRRPVNFLFVGRIAPNKKIEDHIRLAELYKRYVDTYYRFIFVGQARRGSRVLRDDSRDDGGVPDAGDRFWFTGPVPNEDLAAFYRTATVYISLSEHEGFCVPLVEAMAADVPVLAYAAGGGAGDTRRRRRAVRAEGPGVRGGAARRTGVRHAAATKADRRPARATEGFGRRLLRRRNARPALEAACTTWRRCRLCG